MYTVNNTVSEASKHVSIFAHTVSFIHADAEYNDNRLWNIKNIRNIVKSGLIKENISGSYIVEEHFLDLMDEIIANCLQYNNNNTKNLSRLSAILNATSYISLPLALKYPSDDSFTDDMIIMLGKKINTINQQIEREEDYEYIIRIIHELPETYSNIILG